MNDNQNPVYYQQPQPEPPKEKNGMSVASLVMGIVGLTCCGGGIVSILAIVFAVISKNKNADGQMDGMAKAGLIMGIVAVVMSIIVAILSAVTGLLPLLLTGDFESALESLF